VTQFAEYASLDTRFRIRCDDPKLARRIAQLYDACRVNTTFAGTRDLEIDIDFDITSAVYEIRADGALQWRGAGAEHVAEWCAWLVNNAATTGAQPFVLHAAAAALEERAVIIAAASGAGKSTLVAALTLAGWSYMGDDSIAVCSEGPVVASNPKPIAVDEHARAALRRLAPGHQGLAASDLLAPAELGSWVPGGHVRVPAVIVQPSYRPNGRTRVTEMSPGDAAEVLAYQSFNFDTLGAAALRDVVGLARRCTAMVVEYSDVAEAVDVIAGAMHRTPEVLPPSAEPRPMLPGCFDVEMCEGEAMIWDGATRSLHHLSASATAVLMAYDPSATTDMIAATVTPTSGARRPERAEIAACLDELRERGLLTGATR